MAAISQNQNDYLQNLVKAGGGNGEWAKSQLNGATVEQPKQPLSAIVNSNPGADLINSSYEKNLAAFTQRNKSLRDTQLAGLAGQEDVINQNKVSGLNANDVLANNNWRSLKESMANAGVNGGDSVTAQIGNQTAQQQGAVDINNNASNQLKQLMAQRAAINNNASADDLALMQGLQATRDTQSLADLYKNRDFNYQVGRDTVGDSQWNKSFDYNAGQDTVKNNQWDKSFDYNSGQDTIKNGQWDKQFDYGKTQDTLANIRADKQLDNSTRQTNASISNMGADNSRQSLGTLFDIWDRTGVAPAGIPGVTPGTTGGKEAVKAKEEAAKKIAESAKKMDSEKSGLVNALDGGDIQYSEAEKKIRSDLATGFYTSDEAAELMKTLQTWAASSYGQRWN